jgi:hypothetical protein
VLLAGLLAGLLPGLFAASAQAAPMSRADFRSDQARIGADYQAAAQSCNTQGGNAARVCLEQARSVQRLARAELDYRYSGRMSDQARIPVVAAQGAFAVAKVKCADQALANRDVCVKQARSELTRSLADASQGRP